LNCPSEDENSTESSSWNSTNSTSNDARAPSNNSGNTKPSSPGSGTFPFPGKHHRQLRNGSHSSSSSSSSQIRGGERSAVDSAQARVDSAHPNLALRPLDGSDAGLYEIAVDGWTVVQRPEPEWDVGGRVVFVEIDSFVPGVETSRPIVLNGIAGIKVNTRKILGVLSQGFLMPVSPELEHLPDGTDVSKRLGIAKFSDAKAANKESNKSASAGIGPFPAFVEKTDQERMQNLVGELFGDAVCRLMDGARYEVTVKLDGSSTTCFRDPDTGRIGVCSRNQEVSESSRDSGKYWEAAREARWPEALETLHTMTGQSYAFQGELVGPKIQNNPLGLDRRRVYLFDIFWINRGRKLNPEERRELLLSLNVAHGIDIAHVPILEQELSFVGTFKGLEDVLSYASSARHPDHPDLKIEGVVFKLASPDRLAAPGSFKAINNEYLLAPSTKGSLKESF
jgi:RNA ligase (TIGR02306 family)